MDRNVAKMIDEDLERLNQQNIFCSKRIIVTPFDDYTSTIISVLGTMGYNVEKILDSRRKLPIKTVKNVEIINQPFEFLVSANDIAVISTSPYLTFLEQQLLASDNIIEITRVPFSRKTSIKSRLFTFLKKNLFITCLNECRAVLYGFYFYKKLKASYQCTFRIFPYNSIGDIYILGMYLQSDNPILKGQFALIISGEGCRQVAEMVGFKNIIKVSERELHFLCKFWSFSEDLLKEEKLLHYGYSHTSLSWKAVFHSGKCFIDLYDELLFHSSDPKCIPVLEDDTISDSEIANKYGLPKEKSVILAPYAKSVALLPIVMWEKITELLINLGYAVYTNCNGTTEKPINGTKTVFFNLKESRRILNYAGHFIGLRSGFCDVISNTDCNKVILYPKEGLGENNSLIKFYSLTQVPGAQNYSEFEYKTLEGILENIEFLYKRDSLIAEGKSNANKKTL